MIHTLELSKMISKKTFDNIIVLLNIPSYKRCWITTDYKEKGLTVIRLYKFKRKEVTTKVNDDTDLTHYYMICISVNTGVMFGGDNHLSNNLLHFTPDFVRAIYEKIFDIIPCMEQVKAYRYTNTPLWFEVNAFKAHRIDFCFDLKTMHQEYLTLIDRGYSLRKNTFERTYFDDTEILSVIEDDEPNVPDVDTMGIIPSADVSYAYFKSKGVNINIYLKEREIIKEQLSANSEIDYDFLRIEVQAKKTKLNAIVSKFKLKGRELHYLATPEVEYYILNSYVTALTGTGMYVTLKTAHRIIDESSYTQPKKDRLTKVMDAVSDKHGIAKLLEQVENGTVTDLGSLKRIKSYLKEIQKDLGINPVTISARMKVPKQSLTNLTGGKDIKEIALPNLTDILQAYKQQLEQEHQQGMPVTQEFLEQINKY